MDLAEFNDLDRAVIELAAPPLTTDKIKAVVDAWITMHPDAQASKLRYFKADKPYGAKLRAALDVARDAGYDLGQMQADIDELRGEAMAVDDAHEPVTAPETPSETPADPSPPEPAETSENGSEVRDPAAHERSREAAGYRVRLRAAEEQLEQRDGVIGALRDEVDRLHRTEAERLADTIENPADLWLVTDLADLRDDAGRLDVDKVKAKVTDVINERPAWRKRTVSFDGGARTTAAPARKPGLGALLKPEERR